MARLIGEGEAVSEVELTETLNWATNVRADTALLDLMLQGRAVCFRPPGGEWTFRITTAQDQAQITRAGDGD